MSKIDGPLAAGSGYDFTVFSVLPNSETGYLPLQFYRKAFRVYDGAYPGEFAPSQVRVTGYGKYFYCTAYDCIPSDLNYVQQTAMGSYVGLVDLRALNRGIMLYHDADTDSGNSGSPIRDAEYESVVIGIQCVGPNDCTDWNNREKMYPNIG